MSSSAVHFSGVGSARRNAAYSVLSLPRHSPSNGRQRRLGDKNKGERARERSWSTGCGSYSRASVERRRNLKHLQMTGRSGSVSQCRAAASELITAPPVENLPGSGWQLPPITEAKRVVLVRHGESTWNATGRIQGSSDYSELTEKGESQAETSRQMLSMDHFDICFHSPLQRSAKTAHIIWAKRNAPMEPIDELREIDLYSFQGLFKEQGKERYGAQYKMWQTDAANFEIDGHYPVRELWDRARACWDRMLTQSGKSVLVVAHNAVNQALVATATGLGPEYFRMLLQSNCGVSVLDFSPSLFGPPSVVLNRLNQTPSPPILSGQSAGRKAKCRVILVCHGMTDSISQNKFPSQKDFLNMLGVVQSRKAAELLLDLRVDTIFTCPDPASLATAKAICEVQEAADCLGADCVPRYVDIVELPQLRNLDYSRLEGTEMPKDAEGWAQLLESGTPEEGTPKEGSSKEGPESLSDLAERAGEAWHTIQEHLAKAEAAMEASSSDLPQDSNGSSVSPIGAPRSGTVILVAHEIVHKAIVARCLSLDPKEALTFNLDEGSLSVIDLPDSATGRGVVRCLNYTAHLGRWAVPVTLPTDNDESF